ncbi:MAG: T9SS type A sorting domain-containing protein, partial [Bacteroidetes bacterium]|nr:T9SS type A sorting domain-containing protein [Bacteroidota bacterium]
TATIEGNYIGTTTTGNGALPNGGPGIEVFTQATIGGFKEDEACEQPCNVISGNGGPGIFVRREATGTVIQGNMIGIGEDGLTHVGNGESGILVLADNVRIGGENDIELFDCKGPCNIIAANGEDGIRNFEVQEFPNLTSEGGSVTRGAGTGGANGLIIEGNFIGTGLPGGGNAGHGIALGALGDDNRVGDTSGRGNLITGNGGAGVLVLASTESTVFNGTTWRGGTGNRIRGNQIMDNGGIAIDLYPNYLLFDLDRMADEPGYGWSDLDMGDTDEGPNTMINWPYLVESGEVDGTSTWRDLLVLWTGSEPGTYALDVYTSASCRGATAEAENFLVSRNLSFPVGGGTNIDAVRVDVPFASSMPYYVATLTDGAGNTSELSNCRRAGERPEQALKNVDIGIRTQINRLLIQLDDEAGGKTAQAHSLLVLRSDATPGGDRFAPTAAETPGGTLVMPQRVQGHYWEVLMPDAGGTVQYDVCLDVAGLDTPDELLVLGRGASTDGRWQPHDTRLETVDGTDYACADGLSAMHLTLGSGGEAALALPVLLTPEDGAEGIDLSAALTWEALPDAASYDLQIALDVGFGVIIDAAQDLASTSYAPRSLARTQQHFWRVRGVTASGETGPWSSAFRFTTGATSVDAEDAEDLPQAFALAPNYPNPFNPQTTIGYELPEASAVRLVVYDVLGRQVAVLVDGVRPAGRHEVTFEAANLPSGVYLYQLQAGAFTQTRRMLLVK